MSFLPEASRFPRRTVASLTILAALVLAGCLPKKEEPRSPSSVEARVGQALSEVFGTSMEVECGELPPSNRPDGGIVYGKAFTEGGKYTGRIRLAPVVCSLAGLVIDQTKSLDEKEILDASLALAVIVHEGVHVGSGNPKESESDVNCKTVQRGYQVAKALGASDPVAKQIQTQMTRQAHHNEGDWTLQDYQVTQDCHDGGPLDLDRDTSNPSIFPYLPPVGN